MRIQQSTASHSIKGQLQIITNSLIFIVKFDSNPSVETNKKIEY